MEPWSAELARTPPIGSTVTEADGIPEGYDAEEEGWPLVVETTWRFRIIAERADGFDFEEVP